MFFDTGMKWGRGISSAVDRKQAAQTEHTGHRVTASSWSVQHATLHQGWTQRQEQCDKPPHVARLNWELPLHQGTAKRWCGGNSAESYFILEILFSKAVLRKFLLETLLIAIDTAAQFIGDLELASSSISAASPFFNVGSWNFFSTSWIK